jgi:uncharacterized lipoprotein YddW (UPF0748 family)
MKTNLSHHAFTKATAAQAWFCLLLLSALGVSIETQSHANTVLPAEVLPAEDAPPLVPEIPREFRGVWVATVANIDWPSKPGLPPEEQRAQAIRILDQCSALHLNVVVLQVRTSCDSLYASSLEPWSYYLTGKQGVAPEPWYDPLQFWVEQAHARGLELHAWFNPFRAKNSGQSYPESPDHISQTQPALVKRYGNDKTNYLWLDPGEPTAREHTLRVFMDVATRYDIDGVHIDDYFYPYPVDDQPFPDEPAWQSYLSQGGTLTRDDWRRDQMNTFIRDFYQTLKSQRPYVKFGISPFGIWKPGYPESVQGFSQHDKLYADARLWLNQGWCDYYSPQLYWPIHAKQQSFPALLQWWAGENHQHRTLAPGLFTSRVGDASRPFTVEQIESQVFTARHLAGSSGVIHFSMKALQENREGLADRLSCNTYLADALTPATPWLDAIPPARPTVSVTQPDAQGKWTARWQSTDPEPVRRWCIQWRVDQRWEHRIVSAETLEWTFNATQDASKPKNDIVAVAIRAVDAAGNISPPAVATQNR